MPVEKCEGYYPYPSNTSMVIYPRASRIFSTSGAACIARSRSRSSSRLPNGCGSTTNG